MADPQRDDPLVRPFRRSDRDQLTALVNAHLSAVVPGMSVPASTVLGQLEREPAEYVVDPWVTEQVTLVAELRSRVLAAALILRYADDDSVGGDYRNAGEIKWFVCWPTIDRDGGSGRDTEAAGALLLQHALHQLERWGTSRQLADGSLPAPTTFGVPDVWPHVRRLLATAGFSPGREETLLTARVSDLRTVRAQHPWPELSIRRSVGDVGTRFTATDEERDWGYIEVDTTLGEQARFGRGRSVADVGNLYVDPTVRRRGSRTGCCQPSSTGWS